MAKSSDAASRHQRVLVAWTVVLSLATLAYAIVAFLPVFWRYSSVTAASSSRQWVLWQRYEVLALPNYKRLIGPEFRIGETEETKAACQKALEASVREMAANPSRRETKEVIGTLARTVITKTKDTESRTTYRCLPVGLDPRPRYKE
jgi:hypothetical protein